MSSSKIKITPQQDTPEVMKKLLELLDRVTQNAEDGSSSDEGICVAITNLYSKLVNAREESSAQHRLRQSYLTVAHCCATLQALQEMGTAEIEPDFLKSLSNLGLEIKKAYAEDE